MDLSITKYGESELSRPSVIVTGVYNGNADKFIVILEGNNFIFYALFRVDDLILSVAVINLEAPQIFIIFLNDLNPFDW